MKLVTLRDMLEAGVHFGHKTRYWNPKMAPYIYGARSKIHIIDLDQTLPRFNQLLKEVDRITANRGKVLFVGTKPGAKKVVRQEAIRCGMPYVDHRWLGGMLTNYKTIRQSIKKLTTLEDQLSDADFVSQLTKKECLQMTRKKDKLFSFLSGVKQMGGLPDLLFVIDVKAEYVAIQEARRLGIPVAAIVDTNASPEGIDYMIPGNDDAMRAIRFYCHALSEVIIEARAPLLAKEREKAEKKATPTKPVTVKKSVQKVKQIAEQSETTESEVAEAPPPKKVVKKPTKAESGEKKPAAKKKAAAEKKKAPAEKTATAKKKAATAKPAAAKPAAAKKKAAVSKDKMVEEASASTEQSNQEETKS
jgi:small subunit ribosomal protein S2